MGCVGSSHVIVNGLFLCVSLPAIGRTLIPRYFSTVFEGGVTDLYYILRHSKESYHSSSITVDCDQCVMVTQHGKPMFTKVRACLAARLALLWASGRAAVRLSFWNFKLTSHMPNPSSPVRPSSRCVAWQGSLGGPCASVCI